MKQFILRLIDAKDSLSSKRFSALVVVVTVIGLSISATIHFKGVCPDSIFNSLLLFAAGCFGINGMESILKKKDDTIPTEIPENKVEEKVEEEKGG